MSISRFILRITPPPARKMIENNVPVAIASDYNPNAHCLSMPYIMSVFCMNSPFQPLVCLHYSPFDPQ